MILLESFKLLHKIDLPYVIAFLIASIGDYLLGLLLLVRLYFFVALALYVFFQVIISGQHILEVFQLFFRHN